MRGWIRRRRTRTVLALVAAMAIALSGRALYREGESRADSVQRVETNTLERLWKARRAEARFYSPEALAVAETAFRAGLNERTVQAARGWPLSDYSAALRHFARAQRAAERAAALALQRRDKSRDASDSAVRRATELVTGSVHLATTIRLPQERRILLSRAQLALTEAKLLHQSSDYGNATIRALQASALAAQVADHAAAVAARYVDAEQLKAWKHWQQETIDWSRRKRRAAIVVCKETHLLTLYVAGRAVRTYPTDMGLNWVADKLYAGDDATPEGRYQVLKKKAGGATRYHKALLLDYPNADDRRAFARARQANRIPRSLGIGGLIEIHGEGGRGQDWTTGCVALSNANIDELYRQAEVGTPVTIIGSDGSGIVSELVKQHRAINHAQAHP